MIPKIAVALFIALCVTGGIFFFAQDRGPPHLSVDAIERKLEMSRHERLVARIAENDAESGDFTTDGCSGGLSLAWEQFAARFPEIALQHGALPPWQECCVTHDQQYHLGGAGGSSAIESFERRKAADLELRACVVDTGVRRSTALQEIYGLTEAETRGLYEVVSELIYRAVRAGGIPCTSQPWRWGYGWPKCGSVQNPVPL